MARVTSKLQVTIPKAIAQQYGIEPGDDVEFLPAGDAIRVVPPRRARPKLDRARRLELFERATERQREREATRPLPPKPPDGGRGWTREELYDRGSPR